MLISTHLAYPAALFLASRSSKIAPAKLPHYKLVMPGKIAFLVQ